MLLNKMNFKMSNLKEEFKKIINENKIIDDYNIRVQYIYDDSLEEGVIPELIITPTSENEIIKIIKYCNNNKIPIIPSSSSTKYYGGTIPKIKAIILDLSRIKKILSINKEDRYVIIELGVIYEELIPILREKGLRICVPLGYSKSASIISTYIDRVPLLTGPKILISEGWQCILNMRIILANGMIVETGTGS